MQIWKKTNKNINNLAQEAKKIGAKTKKNEKWWKYFIYIDAKKQK